MSAGATGFSYGPVPSRRLGRSLGINNIPAKACSYSCVYCQVGRTSQMLYERGFFYDPAEIARDVRCRCAKAEESSERVDYLAFVPDGEPTLDENLGCAISLLRELKIPVAVITNGSLLWRDDVSTDLGGADWVSVKVDSVLEDIWRRINRPHGAVELPAILDGILAFSGSFSGKLVTETMLLGGINDGESCAEELASFLEELKPDTAYLGVPTRPPADGSLLAPDESSLNRFYQIVAGSVGRVEYLTGYEGDDFAFTGDVAGEILKISSVHPMREDAVGSLLSKAGSSWEIIDRLLARGDLAKELYLGHTFYIRKFAKCRGGKG